MYWNKVERIEIKSSHIRLQRIKNRYCILFATLLRFFSIDQHYQISCFTASWQPTTFLRIVGAGGSKNLNKIKDINWFSVLLKDKVATKKTEIYNIKVFLEKTAEQIIPTLGYINTKAAKRNSKRLSFRRHACHLDSIILRNFKKLKYL